MKISKKNETKMLMPYIGNKSGIIMDILHRIPDDITKIIEPFAGTGIISLNVISNKHPNLEEVILNDINPHMGKLYNSIQYNPDMVIEKLVGALSEINETNYKEQYLKIRARMNAGESELLPYIMLYSFNGNPRYNKKWEYNHIGNSNRGPIKNIDKKIKDITKTIKIYNKLMNSIKFSYITNDYKECFNLYDKETLLIMDPPYNKSNVDYTGQNNKNTEDIQSEIFSFVNDHCKDVRMMIFDYIYQEHVTKNTYRNFRYENCNIFNVIDTNKRLWSGTNVKSGEQKGNEAMMINYEDLVRKTLYDIYKNS